MIQAFFRIVRLLERWLDQTPMYIVVSFALSAVVLCTFIVSLCGLGAASLYSMAVSLLVICTTAVGVSLLASRLFRVSAHHLSSLITAMILYLLLSPATTVSEYVVLTAVAALAVISKYLLVYKKQHLVNPAAISIVLLAYFGYGAATWWVATPYLLIPLLVAGGAVVTKMRVWGMVLVFGIVGFGTFLFEGWRLGDEVASNWSVYFLSYPTLFLGFFMLTEPFTLPPTRNLRFSEVRFYFQLCT
jgi:glycine betaine catabolism B